MWCGGWVAHVHNLKDWSCCLSIGGDAHGGEAHLHDTLCFLGGWINSITVVLCGFSHFSSNFSLLSMSSSFRTTFMRFALWSVSGCHIDTMLINMHQTSESLGDGYTRDQVCLAKALCPNVLMDGLYLWGYDAVQFFFNFLLIFNGVVMAFITDVSIVMSYSHSLSPNQSNELGYILLRSST